MNTRSSKSYFFVSTLICFIIFDNTLVTFIRNYLFFIYIIYMNKTEYLLNEHKFISAIIL